MSEMIPQRHRTDPGKLDREVVHNVIMQYVPPGFSAFHRTLENELQQISINLATNGLENIEQAWYKLIKLDKKYCTTVKPKLVIKILTKNLKPPSASKEVWRMMDTGSEEEQNMRGNLILFHNKLVQIAKSIATASRFVV